MAKSGFPNRKTTYESKESKIFAYSKFWLSRIFQSSRKLARPAPGNFARVSIYLQKTRAEQMVESTNF